MFPSTSWPRADWISSITFNTIQIFYTLYIYIVPFKHFSNILFYLDCQRGTQSFQAFQSHIGLRPWLCKWWYQRCLWLITRRWREMRERPSLSQSESPSVDWPFYDVFWLLQWSVSISRSVRPFVKFGHHGEAIQGFRKRVTSDGASCPLRQAASINYFKWITYTPRVNCERNKFKMRTLPFVLN